MSTSGTRTHSEVLTLVLDELVRLIVEAIDELGDPRLEEFRRRIERGELFPLIVRMDPRIEEGLRPDIELFGGRIIIEVKTSAAQFRNAERQVSDYVRYYPRARFAMITDHQSWRLYDVVDGRLRWPHKPLSKDELKSVIKKVLAEGITVIPSPENIRSLFGSVQAFEAELRDVFRAYREEVESLFKAYENIMRRLYEKASPETIEELFIKHTIMQMIILACLTTCLVGPASPEDACSGAHIEAGVASPYLNWWRPLLERAEPQDKTFLRSLVESIYSKALLLDWENGRKEDVFRELYEILIDPDIRRQIGEYYTPLWLVEWMIERVSKRLKGLKGRLVLDPFCGSGTFLVMAFYRKVREGASADEAIKEVVGFDINPLAASIARAELMIAYQNEGGEGVLTPLVFNSDLMTTALTIADREKEPISFVEELRPIEEKLLSRMGLLDLLINSVEIADLLELEAILCHVFRLARSSEDVEGTLRREISRISYRPGSLMEALVRILRQEEIVSIITELIKKYGDSVWAAAVTSLFAPYAIYSIGADVVISNPPWMRLTEVKGKYGRAIRKRAKNILRNYPGRVRGPILNASDISSVFLHVCLNMARGAVAFVMPNEAVYKPGAFDRLGRILTYEVIKGHEAEVIFVNYDVFRHGRIPALLLVVR